MFRFLDDPAQRLALDGLDRVALSGDPRTSSLLGRHALEGSAE